MLGAPAPAAEDGTRLTFGDVPERFEQATGTEAIHVYDLGKREDQILPRSVGLWTSRWSPDGRYIAALTIRGQELMLFDRTRQQWRPMNINHVDNPTWSRDSKYLYFTRDANVDSAVSRIRVADGLVDRLVELTGRTPHWSGIAPDGSPILLETESTEVYALELTDRADRRGPTQ